MRNELALLDETLPPSNFRFVFNHFYQERTEFLGSFLCVQIIAQICTNGRCDDNEKLHRTVVSKIRL